MRKLKILWSVDAFDDLDSVQVKEIGILKALGKRVSVEVDPIYVISPDQIGLSIELSEPGLENYVPAARKAMNQRLKMADLPGMSNPQVLVQHRPSLRATVDVLARHAKLNGYDLILVGSHGRKGFSRLAMGSFAEQLLLVSEVPLLIVGSHSEEWNSDLERILLPNDLSDVDSKLFGDVFDFAKTVGARTTLLHSIPRPLTEISQSGVHLLTGGWMPIPAYIENIEVRRREEADKIMLRAEKWGVPCNFLADASSPSITESILTHARNMRASFIAMVAERGPFASTLLGSVTRQVVRASPCPVLVFRYRDEK